jgi:hypothetical protein
MSKIQPPAPAEYLSQTCELCSCVPAGFSKLADLSTGEAPENTIVPLAPELDRRLQQALEQYFPRSTSFSLLLLHITQFAQTPLPPAGPVVPQRLSCHAPASFLEQVLHPVRRTLRAQDHLLVDERGSGMVFLFPQVERVGIERILERVAHSISLLQAETVVPPLRQQTEITLGVGSYPEAAMSLRDLLIQASAVRERIVFRPAVLPEFPPARESNPRAQGAARRSQAQEEHQSATRAQGIPFMQIPSRLPTRLKQLVPYALALELRCAPVGRDHNRLTVAMANPTDARAIYHLREATGMAIFPVSCERSALETLLASNW